jgi:magnesium transporter
MSFTLYTYNKDSGLISHENTYYLKDLAEDTISWLDIETADIKLLTEIAQTYGLHELTVEDCLTEGHSPKFEDYGQYLFMIFRALVSPASSNTKEDYSSEEEITKSLNIFLSKNFIITHRSSEIAWLDAVGRQLRQFPEQTIALGSTSIAHRVIDILIDRFMRGLNNYEDDIETLENQVISEPDEFEIADLNLIKKNLTNLRHVMRDQRIVITRLSQDHQLVGERQLRRYFKDIEDHALAILTQIDKNIDTIVSTRDAYFAMASVRLGDTMRVLAVITTIGMPLHLVVGIYGMNFDIIPLTHDPYGFWVIMGSMLILALCMLVFFRKNSWI